MTDIRTGSGPEHIGHMPSEEELLAAAGQSADVAELGAEAAAEELPELSAEEQERFGELQGKLFDPKLLVSAHKSYQDKLRRGMTPEKALRQVINTTANRPSVTGLMPDNHDKAENSPLYQHSARLMDRFAGVVTTGSEREFTDAVAFYGSWVQGEQAASRAAAETATRHEPAVEEPNTVAPQTTEAPAVEPVVTPEAEAASVQEEAAETSQPAAEDMQTGQQTAATAQETEADQTPNEGLQALLQDPSRQQRMRNLYGLLVNKGADPAEAYKQVTRQFLSDSGIKSYLDSNPDSKTAYYETMRGLRSGIMAEPAEVHAASAEADAGQAGSEPAAAEKESDAPRNWSREHAELSRKLLINGNILKPAREAYHSALNEGKSQEAAMAAATAKIGELAPEVEEMAFADMPDEVRERFDTTLQTIKAAMRLDDNLFEVMYPIKPETASSPELEPAEDTPQTDVQAAAATATPQPQHGRYDYKSSDLTFARDEVYNTTEQRQVGEQERALGNQIVDQSDDAEKDQDTELASDPAFISAIDKLIEAERSGNQADSDAALREADKIAAAFERRTGRKVPEWLYADIISRGHAARQEAASAATDAADASSATGETGASGSQESQAAGEQDKFETEFMIALQRAQAAKREGNWAGYNKAVLVMADLLKARQSQMGKSSSDTLINQVDTLLEGAPDGRIPRVEQEHKKSTRWTRERELTAAAAEAEPQAATRTERLRDRLTRIKSGILLAAGGDVRGAFVSDSEKQRNRNKTVAFLGAAGLIAAGYALSRKGIDVDPFDLVGGAGSGAKEATMASGVGETAQAAMDILRDATDGASAAGESISGTAEAKDILDSATNSASEAAEATSSAAEASADVVKDHVAGGDGITHTIGDVLKTETGLDATGAELAELFTANKEELIKIPGVVEMPDVWGGYGFGKGGVTTELPTELVEKMTEELKAKRGIA